MAYSDRVDDGAYIDSLLPSVIRRRGGWAASEGMRFDPIAMRTRPAQWNRHFEEFVECPLSLTRRRSSCRGWPRTMRIEACRPKSRIHLA